MKLKGVVSAVMLFMAGIFRSKPDHNFEARGRITNGRGAFYGVSAARCHTQKYKHGRAHY